MICPECRKKIKGNDPRLLAFHLACHGFPNSIVINVLRRMGYIVHDDGVAIKIFGKELANR